MPSLLIWTPSTSPLGANIPPQLPIPHVRSKDSHFAPPCPVALGLNCLGRDEEELHIIFFLYIYIYIYIYIFFFFFWRIVDLTVFQVHSKVIQLHRYTYIILEIIFHYSLLQDSNCSSLCDTVNLCCLLLIYFFKSRSLAFYSLLSQASGIKMS